MKITILGAGGFVGSHLVEHLVKRGEHDVVAFDLTDEKLSHIDRSRFRFIRGDLASDGELVRALVEDADVVVDLVAHANPSLYVSHPLDVFELNFRRNLEIVELCVEKGKRLIQYSSAEVYGKPVGEGQFCETESDQRLGPTHKSRWIYAASKGLLERVIHAYGEAGRLEYTIVRPFNFIGPRLDYLVEPGSVGGPRVFAHFMSGLLGDGPLLLVDGGHAHRAFCHIEDANEAFQTILDAREECRNRIFNVGNPANHVRIREVAELMSELYRELTGGRSLARLVDVPSDTFYGPGYEDADRLPPAIDGLAALGWKPLRDLRTTFRDAMLHYVERPLDPVASATGTLTFSS